MLVYGRCCCLVGAAAALGAAAAVGAQTPVDPSRPRPALKRAEELVSVRTLLDTEPIGPGETFHLAVVFDVEPKWHIYWKNPGAGALPLVVTVTAPEGFRVAEPIWTRPRVFDTTEGEEYGYETQAVLFVPITAPGTLSQEPVEIRCRIRWAVCKDVCLLGDVQRTVVVQTARRPGEPPRRLPPLLRKHLKRLPRPLTKIAGGSVTFRDGVITLSGPAGGTTVVKFLPEESPGVTYSPLEASITGDRFKVRVQVTFDPKNALGEPMALGGLVALGEKADDPCYDFRLDSPVP